MIRLGHVAALIAVLSMLQSGCALLALGAAGVAGYKYAKSKQNRHYEQSANVTKSAAYTALAQMGMTPTTKKVSDSESQLVAKTRAGNVVRVHVLKEKTGSTVSFKKGAFGDEDQALAFFEKLEESLPPGTAEHEQASFEEPTASTSQVDEPDGRSTQDFVGEH